MLKPRLSTQTFHFFGHSDFLLPFWTLFCRKPDSQLAIAQESFFALRSSLLPFLWHWRHLDFLKRGKDGGKTPAFLRPHFILFAVDAVGQMFGNIAGSGFSYARLRDMKFNRHCFLPPEDATLFEVANAC